MNLMHQFISDWVSGMEKQTPMNKPQYSAEVDAHIYIHGGVECETPEEWAQLAVAALDQAGLSIGAQEKVQKLITELMDREGLT